MNTLFIVRHGETDENRRQVLLGDHDPPINSRGEQEARLTADWLRKFGAAPMKVVSSPKLRALQTAQIIAERLGTTVNSDSRLRERNLGPFDNLTRQRLAALRAEGGHEFVDITQDWERVSGVEQDRVVAERALRCADLRPSLDHCTVLVTHAGVAKSIFHNLFSISPDRQAVLKIRNGGAIALTFRDDCVAFEGLFNPRVQA